MLRIDRTSKTLVHLNEESLPDAGLTERGDIQKMIRNSPGAFFAEMGEELLLVGEEIRPADLVDDRIDLLALDPQGAMVIIEIKRGASKLHLLQALTYAAMVSHWEGDRVIVERQQLKGSSREVTEEEIELFLREEIEEINWTQRIVLLAEGFDYSVLVTAEWLTEQYELDIRCYRLALAADGQSEFLACTCIYPPAELAEHAVRRGRHGRAKPVKMGNWEDALQTIENEALVDFFQQELRAGRENNLGRKRYLSFRINEKRRYSVHAKRKHAYVWQEGRFDADVAFWSDRLGAEANVQPVKNNRALRFHLATPEQFTSFSDAFESELQTVEFGRIDELDDMDTEE